MNCDQVFDILTRGPFPTGEASDHAVERHLNGCAECRRLAAALQPAVEFFQEAIPVEESHDLPGYWGEVFEKSADSIVCQTPSRIAGVTLSPRLSQRVTELRNVPWGQAIRIAAVVMISVGLALSLGRVVDRESARPEPWATQSAAQPSIGAVPEKQHARSATLFDFTSLAVACREPVAIDTQGQDKQGSLRAEALENEATVSQHCCTRCHNAAAEQSIAVSVSARSDYLRSCAACHVPGNTGAALEAGISG